MENKNVAVLGELGIPGADGFGVAADTREIRVFDEEGKAVYTKRAADTLKSADAHIRDAGFKRVGEWEAGIAPVEPLSGFKRSLPYLIGVAITVLLFAGCQAVFNGSDETDDDPTEHSAIYYCEQAVKRELKAPSTAVFSGESASGSGSLWTSSGIVESENSFGGMTQTRFACDLRYSSGSQSWRATVSFP